MAPLAPMPQKVTVARHPWHEDPATYLRITNIFKTFLSPKDDSSYNVVNVPGSCRGNKKGITMAILNIMHDRDCHEKNDTTALKWTFYRTRK